MPKKKNENREPWRLEWKAPRCCIGIDQSYTTTGLAISVDGKPKKVTYIDFRKVKTKTEKRREISRIVRKACEKCLTKFPPSDIIILVEQIRTITNHRDIDFMTGKPILSLSYIKSTGALIAAVVDAAFDYGIPVYSVPTVSWKTQVLGSSKPLVEPLQGVKDPQKIASVKNALRLGFGEQISIYGANRSLKKYSDDAADAMNISLYGFVPVKKLRLQKES